MKILTILLTTILLFSCDQSENHSSSKLDTLSKLNDSLLKTPKAENFFLKYKFKKKDNLQYKITTISETNQQIEGDTLLSTVTEQKVVYLIDLSVSKIDNTNQSIIDFTVKSIISEGEMNGEKLVYNSKYIYSDQERLMFLQYEAIKNQTFTVKFSENGKVLDVFNMDKIIDEIIDIQYKTVKIKNEQKQELLKTFKEGVINPLVQQLFRKFPSKMIGVNSAWNDKYYTNYALFEIENVASYQVKNIKTNENDSLVTISAGLSINWTGNHEANEDGVKYYFYDPIVSGSGIIIFNKTKGLLARSETSTRMELVMDMESLNATQQIVKGKRTDITTNRNIVELVEL